VKAKALIVAAGVPPAVEPGILPGGESGMCFNRIPGGKMPPFTAGGTLRDACCYGAGQFSSPRLIDPGSIRSLR